MAQVKAVEVLQPYIWVAAIAFLSGVSGYLVFYSLTH